MPTEVSHNLNVKRYVLYNLMNIKKDSESCLLNFVALTLGTEQSIYPKDLLGEMLREKMESLQCASKLYNTLFKGHR